MRVGVFGASCAHKNTCNHFSDCSPVACGSSAAQNSARPAPRHSAWLRNLHLVRGVRSLYEESTGRALSSCDTVLFVWGSCLFVGCLCEVESESDRCIVNVYTAACYPFHINEPTSTLYSGHWNFIVWLTHSSTHDATCAALLCHGGRYCTKLSCEHLGRSWYRRKFLL